MTEKQAGSQHGTESRQQTQADESPAQSIAGVSLSGIIPTASQPPPIKPTQDQILSLQRTIGNNATQKYLNTLPSINTNLSKKAIQRTRSEEDDIEIPLPSELMSFEDLVSLIAEDSAFRTRMIARSDDGAHIRDMLRNHSNLQSVYRQLELIYRTGTPPSPLHLHIRLDYEFIEGSTTEERVDHIEFDIPGFSMETFDDDEAGSIEADSDDEQEEYGLETSSPPQ